jgi:hypothetical protein
LINDKKKREFASKEDAAARFRRKSALPLDESVLTELSRHKSLEDVLSSNT